MIQAVCFDMDGVLFDTEALGAVIGGRAIEMQGFALDEPVWRSVLGMTWTHTQAVLAARYPEMDLERFLRDWKELTLLHVHREGVPLKPFVRETLRQLRQRGLSLAICSSNDPDVIGEYLALSGLGGAFAEIVTAADVSRGKPDPEIYLTAARRLGVSPGHCAGVEDSPAGVRALRAAGMRSVMVPDLIPFTEELAPYTDAVLRDLSGLEAELFPG